MAEDTSERNRQQLIDLSEVAGDVRPVLPAGGSPLADLVNSVGPVGPWDAVSIR